MSEKYATIYEEAHFKGIDAAKACQPTPMVVGSPSTPLGSEIDYSQPTYYVEGGVCGFAWVVVQDARTGFARWLKKNHIGKTRYGASGVCIWVSYFGQSMARKEAYAIAFAEYLNSQGIKAYSDSRMD